MITELTQAQKDRFPEFVKKWTDIGLCADPANRKEADRFFDHFQSNGWRVAGKTPMKDWQAAARNWIRRIPKEKEKAGATKNYKKECPRCGGSGIIPPSMKACWCEK